MAMQVHEGDEAAVIEAADAATGGLTWGVRRSFVAYIRSLADGVIEVGGGAQETSEGAFHFPLADEFDVDGAAERWIRGRGAVRFEGHGGMLTVPLVGLAVRVLPTAATLFCEQSDGAVYPLADIHLGEPVTDGGSLVWPEAPVVLNAEGARYFGAQYPAGTAMDPIRIHLPLP